MQKLVKEIVDSVSLPVSVKTRLGWDDNSIQILEVAKDWKMWETGAYSSLPH